MTGILRKSLDDMGCLVAQMSSFTVRIHLAPVLADTLVFTLYDLANLARWAIGTVVADAFDEATVHGAGRDQRTDQQNVENRMFLRLNT